LWSGELEGVCQGRKRILVVPRGLQRQRSDGPDPDEALGPTLSVRSVLEGGQQPERALGIGPGEQDPSQHQVLLFARIPNVILCTQAAFLGPLFGVPNGTLGQQQPGPLRRRRIPMTDDRGAWLHLTHRLASRIHVSPSPGGSTPA
jgi:hypothetical protein